MELAGRLHPLLVHLPIGFLVLAFVFELLSYLRNFRKLRAAVPISVFMGAAAAVFSVLTGLVLSEEGGYESDLLFRHRLFGIITAAIAIMLWLIINYEKNLEKSRRRPARLSVFVVLIAVLTITGNFGGSITHGRGYLSSTAPEDAMITNEKIKAPSYVYKDIVKPILDSKCISCHGANKQKGKLRLDTEEFIVKGGKAGSLFPVGKSQSELIRRIHLNAEDEDHMPPPEKTQLTPIEIQIISDWVVEKNPFEVSVDKINSNAVRDYVLSLSGAGEETSYWPTEPIEPAPEKYLKVISPYGVVCSRLGQESNYLELKVPADFKPDADFWNAYQSIVSNIFSLDLSGFSLSEAELEKFLQARQIRKLYLSGAHLENFSLAGLMELKSLRYLNLVSTGVRFEKLKTLAGHPSLKEIYAFGNELTAEQISEFSKKNQAIRLEPGNFQLPFRATDTIVFRP